MAKNRPYQLPKSFYSNYLDQSSTYRDDLSDRQFGPDYWGIRKLLSATLYLSLYDLQPHVRKPPNVKPKSYEQLYRNYWTARKWVLATPKSRYPLHIDVVCDALDLDVDFIQSVAKRVINGKIRIELKRCRAHGKRSDALTNVFDTKD